MNSKFLYVATVAISLLGTTLAMADDGAPLTRAQVNAGLAQAIANGTLQRTDHDDAALVARRANAHAASAKYAQRVKAALSRSQG